MESTRLRWLVLLIERPLVSSQSACTYDLAVQLERTGLAGQGFGFSEHGNSVDYCKSPLTTSEECKMNCTFDPHCTGFSYYHPDHAEGNSCASYMGNGWRISLGGQQTCPAGFPIAATNRGSVNVAGARFSIGGANLTTYRKTVPTCLVTTTTTNFANITNSMRNPRDPRCRCLHYDRYTQGNDILKTRVEACKDDSLCNWEKRVGSLVTAWTGCCYAKDGGMSKMSEGGCSGPGCCRSVPEDVDCSQDWLDLIKAAVSPANAATLASCLGIGMLALHSFN